MRNAQRYCERSSSQYFKGNLCPRTTLFASLTPSCSFELRRCQPITVRSEALLRTCCAIARRPVVLAPW